LRLCHEYINADAFILSVMELSMHTTANLQGSQDIRNNNIIYGCFVV